MPDAGRRAAPGGAAHQGSDDAALGLAAAIRALDVENRRMRADMARRTGLSDNEFGAVAFISEVATATPKTLAEELGLTTGAVTALLDRLEHAGLVTRRRHVQDRRSTLLVLTARGADLRDWIFGTYRAAFAEATTVAGEAATRTAIDVLNEAAAAVREAIPRLSESVDGRPEVGRIESAGPQDERSPGTSTPE